MKQCKSCPWRRDSVPDRDIPNGYSCQLHAGLANTIATGLSSITSTTMHVMACHYSEVGKERPCAGWLHHQLGVGNNIGVRIRVMRGDWTPPIVDGPQHQTFEDTLPRPADRKHNFRCSNCGRRGHNIRTCSEKEVSS